VRGRAPTWLRLAVVCVVLVVVPITAYLFVYQRQRVEQATVRNFRALDAASDRVVEVMERLSGVVGGSSFGISPTMLDEVTERITGQRTGCITDEGVGPRPWDDPVERPGELLRLRRPAAAQRLEYRYRRAAEILVKHNRKNGRATERLWNQLHCLIDTHRRYSAPVETIQVEVGASPRVSLRPPTLLSLSRQRCGDQQPDARCRNLLRELLASEECEASVQSPRLNAGRRGMEATIADCRPFDQRNRDLHRALEAFDGSEGVIEAIDLFGIQSRAQLNQLMQQATGYLSRFFDSHLIADGGGRILFEAEAVRSAATEIDENRVATPAFSGHVDISELLRADSPPSARIRPRTGGNGEDRAAPYFLGRSFVKMVPVQDIELRAFVHPFILDGIDVSGGSEGTAEQDRTSSTGAGRPTFYMVGIVDNSEFQSAAIKLRLSLVIYATLLLLVLLTLSPVLWFWTAGDRLIIGRLGLAGVCATPVVGVVLLVVLACAMVTNRIDGQVLDGTVVQVADRMVELFDQELRQEILELQRRVPRLLAIADGEAGRRPPQGGTHIWQTTNTGRNELSQLERTFYCDDSDRSLPYHPLQRDFNVMLIDDQGLQLVCLSSGALTRTPKLGLQFRGYFQLPKARATWRPPTGGQHPVRCRVRDPRDEESRIPCIVDDLPERSKRLVTLAHTPRPSAGSAEVPYVLERIDSVVRADVQTVLGINTARPGKPVAAAGVRLNSLDRAVPPEHIDFAVIDRETGKTLFHSDDGLAMATNFVEDVGGSPALWSLLHAGARGTIDLAYAGIPIRAHVRPLREGMPWVLIVYRGHEIEDRLTVVTTALSIFSTLLWLVVAATFAVLMPLVIHWSRPGMLEGVASGLGRVMGMSSRFRWAAGAALALALALLLYSPWLTWTPWPASNPWLPWNPWDPDSVWNPWRAFPFFAAYAVIAAVAFVVYSVLGASKPTAGNRYGAGTFRRVLVLAAVIVCLAVVPPGLWFGHHRAALGVGVNHYLVDRTLDSVARAREDYRLARLREFGAGQAPAGDRTLHRLHEEPEPDEGWMYAALRPVVGLSTLSNELMVYRALPPATADDVASLYGAFSRTFGYDIRWPFPEPHLGPLSILSSIWLLLMAILVGGVAYFICAICTIVRGRRGGVVELPDARVAVDGLNKGDSSTGRLLRVILLYRNRGDADTVVDRLKDESPLRLLTHHVEKCGNKCPRHVVNWTPRVPNDTREEGVLYVFNDLGKVLEDSAEGRALFDELERLVDKSSPILMWSRVVPDYRYSDRFGPTDRWFGNRRGDDEDRRSRWGNLARGFRSYVLHRAESHEESFRKELHDRTAATARPAIGHASEKIQETMLDEAVANPELLDAAVGVAADAVVDLEPETMHADEACALAVTRFRKCAGSYFNEVWEQSTHDERLQLYALSRGGVVNSRRTAALSSLVNRGIVEVNDATGMVRLRSTAFREFIEQETDKGELDAWRKEGGGGVWQSIWPPLAIAAVLGLAFLAMANPEIRTTLLTALLGLLPAALPFFRGGQSYPSTGSTST